MRTPIATQAHAPRAHAPRARAPRIRAARTRAVASALALLLAVSAAHAERAPTVQEQVLSFFAQHLGSAALCDWISWDAYQHFGLLFGGGGSAFFRSECYEHVAEARNDPTVCSKYRPAWKLDPLASFDYSAAGCRRRTREHYASGGALSDDELVGTFEHMGYDIDEMPAGIFPPPIGARDVYFERAHEAVTLARAEELLAAANGDAAAQGIRDSLDAAYVADLLAIGRSEASWCEHIAADVPHPGSERVGFRDWCYYTLAANTGEAALCARMRPASEDPEVAARIARGMHAEVAHALSLQGNCEQLTAPAAPPHRGRYGPEWPADGAEQRRLLALLGITLPRARDWPASERARYYLQYLFGLEPAHRDAVHDSVREDMVKRLLAYTAPTV